MDRETVVQNLVNNYGEYGITREILEPLIDDGVKEGFSYELIYWQLKAELSKLAGEEFYCTSEDMARAFGVSEDIMNRIIEESREELISMFSSSPDRAFSLEEIAQALFPEEKWYRVSAGVSVRQRRHCTMPFCGQN